MCAGVAEAGGVRGGFCAIWKEILMLRLVKMVRICKAIDAFK